LTTGAVNARQQPGVRQFFLKNPGEPENYASNQVLLDDRVSGISAPQQSWQVRRYFARAAYTWNGKLLSQAHDDIRNARHNVHVLVSVEVGRQDSGTTNFDNLPPQLGFRLRKIDLSRHDIPQQATCTPMQPPTTIKETGNSLRGRNRLA